MRREVASEEWPGDAREPEHRAEDPLIAAALARWHDVADHGLRRHRQAPAAETLDRAEDDQLRHVTAQPAERRGHEEEDDRALENALAPIHVAELSVERRDD